MAAHAQPDRLTLWWRSVSLRAKVTGVTVALLVIGLFAAGIGTLTFVRGALIGFQDEQLVSRARSDLGAGLLDVTVDDEGRIAGIRLSEAADSTDYYVAVYYPDGTRLGTLGPSESGPEWPKRFPLAQTVMKGTEPFVLTGESGDVYHASAATLDLGIGQYYTQIIALPLARTDRIVATFFGIFTILALVIIAAGAFATRYLVTRTFRPLAQVESAADAIAEGDFGQRLAPGDPGTEVGKLTTAINTMLDRIDAALSARETTVRQMRRFIGDASHELRTPLVTVRGYAELYRMGAIRGEDDIAQAMERIEKEAVRMGGMVEDLLALARLDERRDIERVAVDLRPLARDAAMDLRAAAPQRTVTVVDETAGPALTLEPPTGAEPPDDAGTPESRRRGGSPRTGVTRSLLRRRPRTPAVDAEASAAPIDLSPTPAASVIGRPPIVVGDENKIRQIVANLLGNARRFTADDSPIEIAVGTDTTIVTERAPYGMGWISIADHGEGIPEQIRERIFERFWRADSSRTRETGGTGLGLAIVASIVEALNGAVAVSETPGGGATFRVSLPLAKESILFLDTQPLPELAPEEV